MKQSSRHSTACNGSFFATLTSNRSKVVVLVTVAAVLIAVEALGYFRDVDRPSSVHWLFKPND